MRQIVLRLLICIILLGVFICSSLNAQQPDIPQEQRERLKTFAVETRAESHMLRDQVKRGRSELKRLYKSYLLDNPAVETALANLEKAQLGLLRFHLQSQNQLRKFLTKDQFIQFSGRMEHKRTRAGRRGTHIENRYGTDMLGILQLTSDQLRRFQVANKLQSQTQAATKIVEQETKGILAIYSNYEMDEQAARKALDRIHKAQIRLSRVTHQQEILLRSVLTEQQFQKLRTDSTNTSNDSDISGG